MTIDNDYDDAFRLTQILTENSGGTDLQKFNYTYKQASTTGYTYNSANELCQRQSGAPAASCPTTTPPYTYDENGNQTAAPGERRRTTCSTRPPT